MIIEKTYKKKDRKKQEMNKSKKKVVTADTLKKVQYFQPGSSSKHQNYSIREFSENVPREAKTLILACASD